MASGKDELAVFHSVLRDLGQWLGQDRVPHVVIGGVAAALLGRTRATQDVDVLVWTDEGRLDALLESGQRWGFVPRIADAVEFAGKVRILLVLHEPTKITVDVALGAIPFEQDAIANRLVIALADFEVCVPRPEDLILMKCIAQRDQDIRDIAGIVARQPSLDHKYLQQRAEEFAAMLDDPNLPSLVEHFVKPTKKRKK